MAFLGFLGTGAKRSPQRIAAPVERGKHIEFSGLIGRHWLAFPASARSQIDLTRPSLT